MSTSAPRALLAAALVALHGCFSGNFLAGQPCEADAECGPNLRCEEGRCGGATAGDPSSSGSTTTTATADPTSTTTTTPAETTLDPSATTGTTSTITDPTTTTTGATDVTTTTGDPSTTGPSCGVGSCEMIDVLLVLDNSPSMASKYNTLLTLIVVFGEVVFPLLKQACSVHVGTVTTNTYALNQEPCDQIGALVRAEGGEPCPFVEGNPYATSADLGNIPSFNCILTVGAKGNPDERPMEAIYKTFGAINNEGACNDGFHREGALLVLLIATDEDDGDKDDPQGFPGSMSIPANIWPNTIQVAKGGADKVYVAAVLGDPDPDDTACPWDPLAPPDGAGASHAPVLRSVLEKFPEAHRVIGSICNPNPVPEDYYPLFDEAVAEIAALCGA